MSSGWNGQPRRSAATVKSTTARHPRRTVTPQEVKVWTWLRQRPAPPRYRFRRQIPFAGPFVDFASLNPRVVMEIGGDGHATGSAPASDQRRDEALRREGFVVMRFWNFKIDRSADAVIDRILDALTTGAPV